MSRLLLRQRFPIVRDRRHEDAVDALVFDADGLDALVDEALGVALRASSPPRRSLAAAPRSVTLRGSLPGPWRATTKPRTLTYTTRDVIDSRIDVTAQRSLVRLSKTVATSAQAVGMLNEIKLGRLAGIYQVDQQAPSQRAVAWGLPGWPALLTRTQDAVLVLDPRDPRRGPPLVAFRRNLEAYPARIDAALLRMWQVYGRLRRGRIMPCATLARPGSSAGLRSMVLPVNDAVIPACCSGTIPDFLDCGDILQRQLNAIGEYIEWYRNAKAKQDKKRADLIRRILICRMCRTADGIAAGDYGECTSQDIDNFVMGLRRLYWPPELTNDREWFIRKVQSRDPCTEAEEDNCRPDKTK